MVERESRTLRTLSPAPMGVFRVFDPLVLENGKLLNIKTHMVDVKFRGEFSKLKKST